MQYYLRDELDYRGRELHMIKILRSVCIILITVALIVFTNERVPDEKEVREIYNLLYSYDFDFAEYNGGYIMLYAYEGVEGTCLVETKQVNKISVPIDLKDDLKEYKRITKERNELYLFREIAISGKGHGIFITDGTSSVKRPGMVEIYDEIYKFEMQNAY